MQRAGKQLFWAGSMLGSKGKSAVTQGKRSLDCPVAVTQKHFFRNDKEEKQQS